MTNVTLEASLHIKYRTCCSGGRILQGSAAIFGGLDSAGRLVTARYLLGTSPRASPSNQVMLQILSNWVSPEIQASLLQPWLLNGGFEKAVPGIQEAIFFNLASIFGSPIRRRGGTAAQQDIK